jgi:hypothetical protein
MGCSGVAIYDWSNSPMRALVYHYRNGQVGVLKYMAAPYMAAV